MPARKSLLARFARTASSFARRRSRVRSAAPVARGSRHAGGARRGGARSGSRRPPCEIGASAHSTSSSVNAFGSTLLDRAEPDHVPAGPQRDAHQLGTAEPSTSERASPSRPSPGTTIVRALPPGRPAGVAQPGPSAEQDRRSRRRPGTLAGRGARPSSRNTPARPPGMKCARSPAAPGGRARDRGCG